MKKTGGKVKMNLEIQVEYNSTSFQMKDTLGTWTLLLASL